MKETGRVMEIIDGSHAVVLVERTEACAKCRACVAGLTKKGLRVNARISPSEGLSPGELVSLELPEGPLISAALMMYGLPALMFVAGCAGGYALFGAASPGLGAFAGLLAGSALVAVSYLWAGARSGKKAGLYEPDARRAGGS